MTVPVNLIKNLGTAILKYPEQNWRDALSMGQLQSKAWLIEEVAKLNQDLGLVYVLAGWVGVLPSLMFNDKRLSFKAIRSFDIDSSCARVADTMCRDEVMRNWRFKATTADVFNMSYDEFTYETLRANGTAVELTESPDTIINTSCDHIEPFDHWYDMIPSGKLVILQNNDFEEADETHTNTVKSLEHFRAQAPMVQVLFEGELKLPDYTRFMRIGVR